MAHRFAVAFLFLAVAEAFAGEEPPGLRDRFVAHLRMQFRVLPEFVCSESVARFSRSSPEKPWEKLDTLQFDAAYVGDKELYALPGTRRFEEKRLAAFVSRGSISTGQLALLARHVFLTSTAQMTYRGETEQAGRPAFEYGYDVPAAVSSYHLHAGTAQGITAFQGVFWIDKETLDLLRLEIQAYDIPDQLGIAEAETALDYSRVTIDGVSLLLPRAASLTVVATDGAANLNRTQFGEWKHYRAESTIRFATEEPASTVPQDSVAMPRAAVRPPKGAVIELALDAGLDPGAVKLGDVVTATVAKALSDAQSSPMARGAVIQGRVVRVEKKTMPFPIYEVGLQFDTFADGEQQVPLVLTMQEAGPAPGLVHRAKHLDPTFTRRREPRMEILAPEIQRGRGILEWDARKGPIPRGLKMKWRVEGDTQAAEVRP